MKKKYIYQKVLSLILGFSVIFTACDDFLDLTPEDKPGQDNFLSDEASAKKLVVAAYSPWVVNTQMFGKRFTIICDALTDDSGLRLNGSSLVQVHDWAILPTHEYPRDWWMYAYQSVNAANYAIREIPRLLEMGFSEDIVNPYIAEARFMRAFDYLFLVSFYGEVPLIIEPLSSLDQFSQPRASVDAVYDQIIADLIFARDHLTKDGGSYKGTPTQATAAAFLAKAYLYRKDFTNAETAARQAVAIAEESGYKLIDDYASIFSIDNEQNPELLFYFAFERNSGMWEQDFSVERNIRDLPGEFYHIQGGEGWGYCLPTRDLYDTYEPGDPRRGYTVYAPGDMFGIYNQSTPFTCTHKAYNESGEQISYQTTYNRGDTVRYDYQWSPTGLNVKKLTENLEGLTNVRYAGLDAPVMRMADLYLILAEALAELGNEEALVWINKVRARPTVNMPAKTMADGSLRDIVRHERRVELAMEGQRIFDLFRWDMVKQVYGDGQKVKLHFYADFLTSQSDKFKNPTVGLSKFPTDRVLFPIPQYEMDQNSAITENNPGY